MKNRTAQINIATEQQRFITKVYGWMSLALSLTGVVAYGVSQYQPLIDLIYGGGKFVFFGLCLVELGVVWYFSSRIEEMSGSEATITFLIYSLLSGVTLSCIFLVYTIESISTTFFVSAITFGLVSAWGYVTKTDLTHWGNFLFMALIGLIVCMLINLFLQSSAFQLIISFIGVILFVGLTAYDTQKLKELNIIGNEGTDEDQKEAIAGALTLYLDFINLFLHLLRILGDRK